MSNVKELVPQIFGWQCTLCGWFQRTEPGKPQAQPEKCPDCGCTRLRRIDPTSPRDIVDERAVEHLKKKVERCWNYNKDADSRTVYHALKLKTEIDKSRALATILPADRVVTIRSVCEECGLLYSQRVIPCTPSNIGALREYGLEDLVK